MRGVAIDIDLKIGCDHLLLWPSYPTEELRC